MSQAPVGDVTRQAEPAPPSPHATRPARARAIMAKLATRPWLLAWLAFLPMAVLRAGTLAEADTFWEIRTGLLTISQRAIPAVDPFSWTMRGKPWTLNSWGFNVLLALAYKLAGLPAVAWVCAAWVMAIAALVLVLAKQLGATASVAGVGLFAASPLLTGWLTARPQLADYVAVMALVLLLRQIADGRHPGVNVLAVGMVSMAWVNLHAAALLGVIITAACAVLTAMRRDHRRVALWLIGAAVAALAGMLINPYGIGVIGQTAQVQTASAGIMVEWQHVNPASPVQDLTLTLGALALVLAARRRDVVLAAALATTIAGSIFAVRLLPFVVLTGLPVVAAWASAPSHVVLRYARSRRLMFYRCGAIGALTLVAVAVPSLTHIGRPNLATYPVRIVRAIPPGCRVFTTDLIGGFVILERPDVPVSLDTRNTLYGRQLLLAEERILHGAGNLTSGLAGAGCVLVPPASGLARRLDNDQSWQIKATEPPAAVLFVRRPRLPPPRSQ
jgi:hypothetical protein